MGAGGMERKENYRTSPSSSNVIMTDVHWILLSLRAIIVYLRSVEKRILWVEMRKGMVVVTASWVERQC
jgi:hypothetical protein